jgi:hypothetical protein
MCEPGLEGVSKIEGRDREDKNPEQLTPPKCRQANTSWQVQMMATFSDIWDQPSAMWTPAPAFYQLQLTPV